MESQDSKTKHCPPSIHWHIPILHGILPSKKATLVLLWSTAIHLFYILFFVSPSDVPHAHVYSGVIFGVVLLLYPLSGWLADVYLTRYRAMYMGLWLVVLGSAVATVTRFTFPYLEILGLTLAAVGQALFEVNAIQFGLDQLQTYSTDHHRAFIYWFYCTLEIGHFLYGMFTCVARKYEDRDTSINATSAIFSSLQITFLVLISVLACCWKNRFYHHSTGFHPFKQIVQILNYTRKKRARKSLISGFQFTNNETPDCLDKAKYMYGGPFTTEQVEDVKVFLHILFILIPLSSIYYADEVHTVARQFETEETENEPISYGQCLLLEVPNWIRSMLTVILLPLYILLISRFTNRITHRSWLLWRLGIALTLTLVGVVAMLGIQVDVAVARLNSTLVSSNSVTECYAGDILDYQWLVIPEFLNSLSYVIVFSTTLEFICAQSPYSIKGLLIGIWFAFKGIDRILVSVQQVLQLDCQFSYYIAKGLIITGMILLYGYAARRYRYRKRQDKDTRTILEDYYIENRLEDDSGAAIQSINDNLSYNTVEVMRY